MTPGSIPSDFERIMGCTESDLLRALPAALPEARIERVETGAGIVGDVRISVCEAVE